MFLQDAHGVTLIRGVKGEAGGRPVDVVEIRALPSWKERRAVAKDLQAIYQAPTEEAGGAGRS